MMSNENERWVMFGNTIHFYKDKAPFEKSGVSIKGALEYDKEEDKVKCHECGDWFQSIGKHSYSSHNLPARQYKFRHGLPQKTSLITESLRHQIMLRAAARVLEKEGMFGKAIDRVRLGKKGAAISKKSKYVGQKTALYYNRKGACFLQLTKKVRKLAKELGRTPYIKELKGIGCNEWSLRYKYGSVANFMELCKLKPRRYGDFCNSFQYGKKTLLSLLKKFYAEHGRQPYGSDCNKGYLPTQGTFIYNFGSWNKALKKAGLSTVPRGYKGSMLSRRTKLRLGW